MMEDNLEETITLIEPTIEYQSQWVNLTNQRLVPLCLTNMLSLLCLHTQKTCNKEPLINYN
jgi:hypothetical protein